MYIKVHKGDIHASFYVRQGASRPLVLLLVTVKLAATVAGCVQTGRAREAPGDSCSLYTGYPCGGLKYRKCRDPWRASLLVHATLTQGSGRSHWLGLGLVKPSTFTQHELEHKYEQSSCTLIRSDLCFCQLSNKVILFHTIIIVFAYSQRRVENCVYQLRNVSLSIHV